MVIRKLCQKDAPYMLEWMHDENINKNFRSDFSQMTLEKAGQFIDNSFNDSNQNFAIVDSNDEYMGTISLKNIDYDNRNAEYAIVSRTVAHGTGITFAATKELIDYAFKELKLHKVYLNVLEENIRANKFYQKCGFEFEGTSKECLFLNNSYHNLNWYSMVNH